jgi:uncharacterized protein
MRWIALFEDTADMLQVRRQHEAAHLAYLVAFEREVLIAGGLRDTPNEPFVGGLWVLEVSSRDRAIQLVERDPYFIHGGRRYRLHVWGKALADKQVLL